MPEMGAATSCGGGSASKKNSTAGVTSAAGAPPTATITTPGAAGGQEHRSGGESGKTVVYLGASAPVHATHTRLIQALIDEGFDHIFIFILQWSPDRAGVSAEAGAAQLAKWLLGFPTVDRAKVQLDMVTHEGEGAIKMRKYFGPSAAPSVEVCFSQKYSDQMDRIQTNWLPIYTAEFPTAQPRFLTDQTDPGAATKYGTAAFVESIKSGAAAGSGADTDLYRPLQETAEGWAEYVHGLLNGANGDPFYTPVELKALQAGFFSSTDVIHALDNPPAWRKARIAGGAAEYFKANDPKIFGKFWHKMAMASDTALFKQYCLRAQGVTKASIVEAMPPAVTVSAKLPVPAMAPGTSRRMSYTVLAADAMHSTAERISALDPGRFEYHHSKWRTFPDGTDNITLGGFDPVDKVSGRDVLFLASFHSNASTLSQLHALTWLCESAFIASLTVLLAYLPTGTMERYLEPGRIPAANTLAKMLSALPATGGKRTRVMIYDIHAPPTQYFFANSTAATLHTACPLAIDKINAMSPEQRIDCVAFPDDGACKRYKQFFKKHLPGVEIVTCNKVRTEDGRLVVISEGDPAGKQVLIMDDLIQTGGTLFECAVSLKKAGARTVSGFIVHAVFPDGSWKRFMEGGDRAVFERFWLSSSNPAVCGEIPSGGVFEVLDLAPRIMHDLEHEPSGRAAWQ